jgi:bacterioferritin (cytochrome b1)
METKQVLQILNQALQIEYAAAIQYLQHSNLVQGIDRKVYADFFRDQSQRSMDQARQVGEHIVNLGGVPTVEPYAIKQSTDLKEMLQLDLEVERTALQTYQEGINAVPDHPPLKFFFEEQAYQEYQDIAELEKMLEQKRVSLTEKEVHLRKVKAA